MNEVRINGKTYPVNFGLYSLAEFSKEQGLKSVTDLFALFEAGDLVMMIDLFWHGLLAGHDQAGKELELTKQQFQYSVDQAIMDEFSKAFNAQYETTLPENPTRPARVKKR